MEYPTLYASGKAGFCASSLEEAQSDGRPTDMKILYETIRDVVPSPEPASVAARAGFVAAGGARSSTDGVRVRAR